MPQLIDNLLSVRTNISTIFIRTAFRQHPDKAQEVLATANEVADHADAFAELDYNIFRGLAFASGNPIYGLILNGMKGLYTRIGRHWASTTNCRRCAVKARTIRSTKQCVAMGMRVARFGTGCRKICRVI